MKNMLLSAAIGDISGMPYEFHPNKNYSEIDLLTRNNYTDDTVCTFACAEALMHNIDMAENLHFRCRQDFMRGYGGRFYNWLSEREPGPAYNSFGNGSAMRVSAAGFMAKNVGQCINLATRTAMPTHNHPEGIKGAVATALAIFYAKNNLSKEYIKTMVLEKYYPEWANLSYDEIKPGYDFDETCQRTVPAALICFLHSRDYVDCLKLAIALGGDADTLGAILGPIAYAFYKNMPEELIVNAINLLPKWMLDLNDEFDNMANRSTRVYNSLERPQFTPGHISALKRDEVFVFGSNLAGMHGGGAARTAVMNFGAIMGVGVGMQGQSYAIPTMQGGVETIKPYVDQFIDFALEHRDLFFYVTRIGCGIAGFRDEEIAPLFARALNVDNICLPREFVTALQR